nr:CPCC family cysteine-rich protein [Streptomyces sp. NBC_00830]
MIRDPADGPYARPCCRYVTLEQRGMYEICPVCFWEDDGQDDHDADVARGGPSMVRALDPTMRDLFPCRAPP